MEKVTSTQKEQIVDELRRIESHYESAAAMAKRFGINKSQLSRILGGELERVVSDEKYLLIASELGLDLRGYDWRTARTPTFDSIWTQLAVCKSEGISAMLIDHAGVGKTHAAKEFVKAHANSVYIDCSQVKTKQLLVREIAQKFGLDNTGRYVDVYRRLIFYLNTSTDALIVLDEAGDLAYPAFLELKALWNATEGAVGWYMMGADGLRDKIERNISNRKVGYTELFRRFGERFQQITPHGKEETENFKRRQIAMVAQANGMTNVQELYAKTGGSLTRLKIEFLKLKRKQQQIAA